VDFRGGLATIVAMANRTGSDPRHRRLPCAVWRVRAVVLGQHSFIVKLGATVVYLDVFLSPHKGRQVAPLLTPATGSEMRT